MSDDFAVVDANLAVKWLLEEEYSSEAILLARLWEERGTRTIAPSLFLFETANVFHRRVAQGELDVDAATGLMREIIDSGVALYQTWDLHFRAIELASQLGQGAVYDAHYLALAESLDCEMWTADRRFYRSARRAFSNVRWIGEFDAQGI